MLTLAFALTIAKFSGPQDVFVSRTLDSSQPYPVVRIPALCKARNGDIIAVAEARQSIGDQSGNILVARRLSAKSTHWSSYQVVVSDPAASLNNPCLLVTSGAIWLTYQRYPKGYNERNASADFNPDSSCSSLIVCSRDNGLTWSKPIDITRTVRRVGIRSVASGPGIGIELDAGPHRHRLVFPYNEGANGAYTAFAVYSDDQGKTWTRGSSMPKTEGTNPNECQVAELADGRLIMNCRDQGPSKHRLISYSADGGATWSKAAVERNLPDPTCQGSILRFSWRPSILLFSNPASTSDRVHGTLYASRDEGRTWTIESQLTVLTDSFQYSCLCPLSKREIGVLYETREFTPKGVEGYRIKYTIVHLK